MSADGEGTRLLADLDRLDDWERRALALLAKVGRLGGPKRAGRERKLRNVLAEIERRRAALIGTDEL
ncbi:MAG: hypothetical protein WAL12_20990 [Trebonia sp.]